MHRFTVWLVPTARRRAEAVVTLFPLVFVLSATSNCANWWNDLSASGTGGNTAASAH